MSRAASAVSPADERWMARCLALAARGGRTAPNPQVGCVIVSTRGRVLAEGWHRGPGTAHAEVDALAKLGGRAPGATLYVNLEPCDHHGRTPPCAPAVIASGVARVVIGARDPIPGHAGGARRIARAGIAVEVGVLADLCRAANRGFYSVAERGRPWITLKAAITLDGRIATARGESKWITGPAARAEVHALRAAHDAVMVGIGTVLADDPKLTVRDAPGADPIRVVVDSRVRTPLDAAWLAPGVRRIVATRPPFTTRRQAQLTAAGVEVWCLPADRTGRVALPRLVRALGEVGVQSILVEGGGELLASMLAAGLVDELVLHVAPIALGGRRGGPAWLGGVEVARLAAAHRFTWLEQRTTADGDLIARLAPAPAARRRRR